MEIFVVVVDTVEVGLLFLQLVACCMYDCLLCDSLLGNMLCCLVVCGEHYWLLCGLFLGCFFVLLPPEGSVKWHFGVVMYFLIIVVRC